MKCNLKSGAVALSVAALAVAGTTTHASADVSRLAALAPGAAAIEIDFSEETLGFKPDGFTTVDSPHVSFSSTNGDLYVGDWFQGNGQSILAFDAGGTGGLEIRTSTPTNSISVAFGNDDPAYAGAGSKAVMTLFRNGTEVAEKSVVMNLNEVADQVITQEKGPIFNRAVIVYVNAADDPVNAGRGLDTVFGGTGRDIVLGSTGADNLNGSEGRDFLNGGAGTDRCNGGPDRDTAKNCEARVSIP
jgi:Ca2+-binding RTX toxin-like protein